MENYIKKLACFLGYDHPCTRGFSEIHSLMNEGKTANTGILYTGSHFVFYRANEEEFIAQLLSYSLRIEDAFDEAAFRSINLVDTASSQRSLKIFPLDERAMSEMRKYFKGNSTSMNGIEFELNSFYLTETRNLGKNLNTIIPNYVGLHALIPEKQREREEFIRDFREQVISRYCEQTSLDDSQKDSLVLSEKA